MRLILKFIFIFTLIELFIGGGGRVFELGPLTLRIILFFINIVFVLVLYIYKRKIPKYVIVVLSIAIIVLILNSLIGLVNGAEISFIIEDVKPLSYFFSILFFSYYIDSTKRIQLIISILKRTSFYIALVYIFIQILFYFNKLDFSVFYSYVNTEISSSDFFFRGESGLFFYKGFFFMVVGLIFWIHCSNSNKKLVPIITIIIAMILSGTRGFIVIFGLIYALYYGIPLLLRLNLKILFLTTVVLLLSLNFFSNADMGNKVISDSVRFLQIEQVFKKINPVSFLIGHGFGIGVPIREVHFEIAYLEVFHKQGVIGLFLWIIFFIVLYNEFKMERNQYEIRKAFFLSVVFTFLLSFTNPFFNNPIGLSLLLISWVSFKVLNKNSMDVS
ncbi:hypothetical protein [Sediminicola arcticus]|uniref:O-antigen ligase domain-containing protein n=1 Tax=Sediminicola arcticus TaxID=1574308 RepID=A0ABV2SQV8_9FLAO